MNYHAHLNESESAWAIYAGDEIILTIPGWVPFSVVNEMMRGLNRTDRNGFVTEARTGSNPFPVDRPLV